MDANGWNAAFGELARATMSSPELERYYSVPDHKAAGAAPAATTVFICSTSQRLLGFCFRQLSGAAGKTKDSGA